MSYLGFDSDIALHPIPDSELNTILTTYDFTMDVPDITPSLEKLTVDLDQLEAALKPVLGDVGDVSSKLPLLDKAKLYVMVTYAIESMLFCESGLAYG